MVTPYSMWTKEALIKELQQKQEYIAEKEAQIFILAKKIKDTLKTLDGCCDTDDCCIYADDGVCYEDTCLIADAKIILKK